MTFIRAACKPWGLFGLERVTTGTWVQNLFHDKRLVKVEVAAEEENPAPGVGAFAAAAFVFAVLRLPVCIW